MRARDENTNDNKSGLVFERKAVGSIVSQQTSNLTLLLKQESVEFKEEDDFFHIRFNIDGGSKTASPELTAFSPYVDLFKNKRSVSVPTVTWGGVIPHYLEDPEKESNPEPVNFTNKIEKKKMSSLELLKPQPFLGARRRSTSFVEDITESNNVQSSKTL